eukprot:1159664-Pelagomonas_calceolata.AAC.9
MKSSRAQLDTYEVAKCVAGGGGGSRVVLELRKNPHIQSHASATSAECKAARLVCQRKWCTHAHPGTCHAVSLPFKKMFKPCPLCCHCIHEFQSSIVPSSHFGL